MISGVAHAGICVPNLDEAVALVQAEVKAYEDYPPPNPLDMFSNNYSYDQAPWPLVEQRAELDKILKEKESRNEIPHLPPAEGRFP